jgi:sulfhydrogenase subunit beta (sulfur reductase)
MRYLDRSALERLIRTLIDDGYDVVGPTVRDGVVVLGPISGVADLPGPARERQAPGRYRLERGDGSSLFGTAHGPDSAKRFLFPPRELLATIRRDGTVVADAIDEHPVALFGIHPCDLHAIGVQDRVLFDLDAAYRTRRERALLVGLDCADPGDTCFCTSMGTGPGCTTAFDVALTEVEGGVVARIGTERGERLLGSVDAPPATAQQRRAADRAVEAAAREVRRTVDTADLPAILRRGLDSARWSAIAERCLACSNCTSVCPTCFCHDVVDGVSLSGDVATRSREWASCFGTDHSWTAAGPVRPDRASRYRQWLTHKFGTWVEQFGTSGCVGCGRCITWCPAGIDVTEELAAIRAADAGAVA